jgi:hypothetical protein
MLPHTAEEKMHGRRDRRRGTVDNRHFIVNRREPAIGREYRRAQHAKDRKEPASANSGSRLLID